MKNISMMVMAAIIVPFVFVVETTSPTIAAARCGKEGFPYFEKLNERNYMCTLQKGEKSKLVSSYTKQVRNEE